MLCLYHNDPDGKCAGNIVYEKYKNIMDENKFVEMDYSKEFPFDKLKKDELLIIVDFSVKPQVMEKIYKITKSIIWIDHHKSIIEEYEKYNNSDFNKLAGIRFSGISGCLLTYFYFNNYTKYIHLLRNSDNKDDVKLIDRLTHDCFIPDYIQYVNDFDVWRHEYRDTIPFINYMNSYEFNPTDSTQFNYIKDKNNMSSIINQGNAIEIYNRRKNIENCLNYGFEKEFEGYKTFIINSTFKSSLQFKDLKDKEKYDIFLVFNFNGKNFSYSIYTEKDDIDVSKIAQKYGGGGHKQASGFISEKLTFYFIIKHQIII